MARQGWKEVQVSSEVHEQLSLLKVRLKRRSINDTIKELLKLGK